MPIIHRIRWVLAWRIALLLGFFLLVPGLHAADAKAKAPAVYDAEIRLTGAVNHPGWYPISAESTVTEVIRRAGGLVPNAARVMAVIRKGAPKGFIVELNDPTFHLQPDDEIHVLWTKLK
jgi:hypothetical protein